MTCKEATYLNELKKDGKLSFSQRMGLWVHLLYCNLCRRFVKQSAMLDEQAKQIGNSNGTISPEARQRIQQAMEQGLTNNR